MGSHRASETAPLLLSCAQKSSLAGTLVVGTMLLPVAPRKDLFPIAPGRLKGGNSGQEGDSQRHQPQQKTWINTTAPRAQLNPEQLCPTSLGRERGRWSRGTPCRDTPWKGGELHQSLFPPTFLLFPSSKASSFILPATRTATGGGPRSHKTHAPPHMQPSSPCPSVVGAVWS